MQGLLGVVEGLILLNYARSVEYCDRHDILECEYCTALFGDEWDDEGYALGTAEDADAERAQISQSMQDISVLCSVKDRASDDDIPSGASADEVKEEWEDSEREPESGSDHDEEQQADGHLPPGGAEPRRSAKPPVARPLAM